MNNKIRVPLLVQSGFTLIELMIVITILGILASIAVSSYADYSIRAKISEASAMAAPFTTAVGTYYWANSTLPVSLEQAGQTNVVTKYIENITITSNGLISVDINENSTGVSGITADDLFVILTPVIATGAIDWTCKVNNVVDGTGDNTNIFRFVPANVDDMNHDTFSSESLVSQHLIGGGHLTTWDWKCTGCDKFCQF